MHTTSHRWEAFKENFNVIGLSTAVALSTAMLNPWPLLTGLAFEAIYLVFMPDTRWYQSRLAQRCEAQVEHRRANLKTQVLPLLRSEMQARYERVEYLYRSIKACAKDHPARTASGWFGEVLHKLDFLLEKFLQFAGKEEQFRRHLFSLLQEVRDEQRANHDEQVVPMVKEIRQYYDQEISRLHQLCKHESEGDTRAVLEKRVEVLRRRREFVGQIGKVHENLHHQLRLMEDTFGLISDEIHAQPAEKILNEIDDLVWRTKTMTELLEEVGPFERSLTANAD